MQKNKYKIELAVSLMFLAISVIIAVNESKTDVLAQTPIIEHVEITTPAPAPVKEPQEVLIAQVTAYTGIESCTNPGCHMANGERAYVGAIACPRRIELGTVVSIEGTEYVCSDRTAKRVDGSFDIFMGYTQADYERAMQWGVRTLEVIVK